MNITMRKLAFVLMIASIVFFAGCTGKERTTPGQTPVSTPSQIPVLTPILKASGFQGSLSSQLLLERENHELAKINVY